MELQAISLSRACDLWLDGLVRLGWLKNSSMDLLAMTVELVLATKADLVVFAARIWAFEVLGLDTVLG